MLVQVPPPGQVVATQVVVSRGSPGTQPSYTVTLASHHHHHHQQEYCRWPLGNTLHVKYSIIIETQTQGVRERAQVFETLHFLKGLMLRYCAHFPATQ